MAAKVAYKDYPTVVNEVGESSLSYDNTMAEYARMDSAMQSAQKAIGGSSDTAQLSQSYYWTKVDKKEFDDECKQYYENTVILAVCAQLAIDGCKRIFEVDVNNDLARIRRQPCMKRKKDYPKFMKWTHEIPITKNGKERPKDEIEKEKKKLRNRLNLDIVCPMNWLQDSLDKIQGADRNDVIETKDFFINMPGRANSRQISKVRRIVEEYDGYTRRLLGFLTESEDDDIYILLLNKTRETYESLKKMKISKYTFNRLIGIVLGVDLGVNSTKKYKGISKYTKKMLTLLYNINREMFLNNFKKC